MSSTTRTTTEQGPPQLMPESRTGYNLGQLFYQGQVSDPTIYGGQRTAGATPGQTAAFGMAPGLATRGQSSRGLEFLEPARAEMEKTLGMNYMTGPEQQAAVASAAVPIFDRFTGDVMPGIRDRAQYAGQGVASDRRGVAEDRAIGQLGQAIATGVIAPIYGGERERMTRVALQGPGALTAPEAQAAQTELSQIQAAADLGRQEREIRQAELEGLQAPHEENLARRAAAADALLSAAGIGPGGGRVSMDPSVMRMILGGGKA